MKKMKWIMAGALALLLGVSAITAFPTAKVRADSNDFDCEYSIGSKSDPFTAEIYGCKEIIRYAESEGVAAGVPQGFSGDVLSVGEGVNSGKINRGITLDFSAKKIPTCLVESIAFRVYIGDDGNSSDGYPELRIPFPKKSGAWVMRYPFADKTGSWQDVLLKNGNGSFYTNSGMGRVSNFYDISADGYLNKFELAMRHNGSQGEFYVDSVKITLVANEGVAPVISYQGKEVVTISQGQKLPFTVSAIDAVDGEVDVEYVWGDAEKLDEEGNPTIGTHTLTFRAKDYFGNTAEKTITVQVEEPDLVAPTMEVPVTEIYAKIGAKPLISVKAFDDKDGEVQVVYTWSVDAMDERGRLKEGTQVLTLTAADLSGNTTQKTIVFFVSEKGDTADLIIDEAELCPPIPDIPNEPEISDEPEDPDVPDAPSEPNVPDVPDAPSEPDTPSEPSAPTQTPKKGCGGVIGASAALPALAFVGLLALKKKKE